MIVPVLSFAQKAQLLIISGLQSQLVMADDEEKYIRCIKIGSKDGDEEIWINDDPKNPLILKMKLSFSIKLKQVI